MNREDVIRMARETGMEANISTKAVKALGHSVPFSWLEAFAALVAAAEREACTCAVEKVAADYRDGSPGRWMADQCLRAIRARSNA